MNLMRINKLITQASINNANGFMIHDSNNIRYFSGFTGEGIVIVSENGCVVITDGRYTEQAAQQTDGFDVVVFGRGEQYDKLQQVCDGYGINNICYEAGVVTCDEYNTMMAKFSGINLVPTKAVGATIRKVKDLDEIVVIKRAASATDYLIEMAYHLTKPGITELDLEAELQYIMKKKFSADNAFPMIIAAGEHGSMPHAETGKRAIGRDEMVTLDFGAALDGYKSDMTRTYAVGEPSAKMQEIYEIVKEAQARAQNALKPGVLCKDVDNVARSYITDCGYGENFAHGLGHGVGLNIHEYPVIGPTSNDVLQENMVVTVEPGIYLPGIGGVRIENTCVITKAGHESLFGASTDLVKI